MKRTTKIDGMGPFKDLNETKSNNILDQKVNKPKIYTFSLKNMKLHR